MADESLPEGRQLSDQYLAALNFAGVKHRGQARKGTDIPYLGHLLIVSGIVIEAAGSEVQATAALLHDVVEDQYVTEQEILDEFGEDVAAIVMACSDAAPAPGESKLPWRQRKEHHLARLQSCGPEVLLVAAADKIHNCEAILNDLELHQDDPVQVWNRFNATPADIAWYYTSFLRTIMANDVHPGVVARLRRGVTALAGHAAVAPMTALEGRPVVR
ncbi:MAG: HD domain-containing protein [Actinomycetales bacterium]|nr:HD domain-containing protein [Actinomycetales bacterium]